MKTFDQAIAERGLKVPAIKSAKWHQANQSRQSTGGEHSYPSDKEVAHQTLVAAQVPGFTFNDVVERGDEVQFSARHITDWYVRRYCALNHLKG